MKKLTLIALSILLAANTVVVAEQETQEAPQESIAQKAKIYAWALFKVGIGGWLLQKSVKRTIKIHTEKLPAVTKNRTRYVLLNDISPKVIYLYAIYHGAIELRDQLKKDFCTEPEMPELYDENQETQKEQI